jgi:hypothetical protein
MYFTASRMNTLPPSEILKFEFLRTSPLYAHYELRQTLVCFVLHVQLSSMHPVACDNGQSFLLCRVQLLFQFLWIQFVNPVAQLSEQAPLLMQPDSSLLLHNSPPATGPYHEHAHYSARRYITNPQAAVPRLNSVR